jgi:Heparinase II/III-like protein/Heparinase II/III N-terminus
MVPPQAPPARSRADLVRRFAARAREVAPSRLAAIVAARVRRAAAKAIDDLRPASAAILPVSGVPTERRLPVSFANLQRMAPRFRQRFPDAAANLLARADRHCAGVWDPFGTEQLSLGRLPDWQTDFRSGVRWPAEVAGDRQVQVRGDGSDVKVPWEVSRLQHLPGVSIAWAFTEEARYLDLVLAQLDGWITDNPVGRGINWSCAMEVALRSVSMSWAWEICRHAPGISRVLTERIHLSLFQHGSYIHSHLEDDGWVLGNHYVAGLLGLSWLGILYPGFTGSGSWVAEASRRLEDQLPRQVRGDGGDFESSTSYHRLVLEMLGLVAQIRQANDLPVSPRLQDALRRMARFTSGLLKPNGEVPQIGDNDGGRAFRLLDRSPNEHRYLPGFIDFLVGRDRARPPEPLDPEAVLLLGPTALGGTEAVPESRDHLEATTFPESGLSTLRSAGFYLLAAATPVGQLGIGGHGHNDKLAFELFWDSDVVVDPGTYCYTSDPGARTHFRSTAAHATAQVGNLEQNPIHEGDPFFLPERSRAFGSGWRHEGHSWIWRGEHSGFAPVVHRRSLQVDDELSGIKIVDRFTGGRDSADVRVSFPLAPGLLPVVEAPGRIRIDREAGVPLLLLVESAVRFEVLLEQSWFSTTYTSRTSCWVVRIALRGALDLTVSSTLTMIRG